jgi:hypothetical protein
MGGSLARVTTEVAIGAVEVCDIQATLSNYRLVDSNRKKTEQVTVFGLVCRFYLLAVSPNRNLARKDTVQ